MYDWVKGVANAHNVAQKVNTKHVADLISNGYKSVSSYAGLH